MSSYKIVRIGNSTDFVIFELFRDEMTNERGGGGEKNLHFQVRIKISGFIVKRQDGRCHIKKKGHIKHHCF